MTEVNVSPESAETLSRDEKAAQLIERTALAIFIGGVQRLPISQAEETAWLNLWSSADVDTRVRCRNQARAALRASGLLELVEELEERIKTARQELTEGAPGPLGGDATLGKRASRAYWALAGKARP